MCLPIRTFDWRELVSKLSTSVPIRPLSGHAEFNFLSTIYLFTHFQNRLDPPSASDSANDHSSIQQPEEPRQDYFDSDLDSPTPEELPIEDRAPSASALQSAQSYLRKVSFFPDVGPDFPAAPRRLFQLVCDFYQRKTFRLSILLSSTKFKFLVIFFLYNQKAIFSLTYYNNFRECTPPCTRANSSMLNPVRIRALS
ncbi:hypothetical protein WR25_17304 [Diploscapter pachys]|uniref:Uncharacterized protein n=1 Tax=Diploscapter pachys TaxID=2018661 RepID=A0A2A2L6V0_9BILA|nr:hypothetical protein WR25_17304 [Diploscapter pachys]